MIKHPRKVKFVFIETYFRLVKYINIISFELTANHFNDRFWKYISDTNALSVS